MERSYLQVTYIYTSKGMFDETAQTTETALFCVDHTNAHALEDERQRLGQVTKKIFNRMNKCGKDDLWNAGRVDVAHIPAGVHPAGVWADLIIDMRLTEYPGDDATGKTPAYYISHYEGTSCLSRHAATMRDAARMIMEAFTEKVIESRTAAA